MSMWLLLDNIKHMRRFYAKKGLKTLKKRARALSPVLLTFEGKPSIGYKLSEDARKLLESISSQKL
ncbi:hypothetical protein [Thermofilum sp.]|uniref:hypothetical protein n=1 Tax=Thermofilum sp. TaxID=1961369 RepID=UPI002587006F|nr:hypothetical protein [Thermofilum sp.]